VAHSRLREFGGEVLPIDHPLETMHMFNESWIGARPDSDLGANSNRREAELHLPLEAVSQARSVLRTEGEFVVGDVPVRVH
jgi:hypothetical protein